MGFGDEVCAIDVDVAVVVVVVDFVVSAVAFIAFDDVYDAHVVFFVRF